MAIYKRQGAADWARTMFMDSGMWEKKSMMRQPSWMCVFGFGFSACTMSGNFMPSRMKKTGKLLPTCAARLID